MAHSATHVLKDPVVVNWKDTGGTIPSDRNIVGMPSRTTNPVWIGTEPSVFPISIRIQEIDSPRRYIIPQEVSSADPLDASTTRISSKHSASLPISSKVIGSKFTNESITDVYARGQRNTMSDAVLSKIPNFMDLGLLSVNTTDELGFVFAPTTTTTLVTHGSNWILCSHRFSVATSDRVSGTKSKQNYNFKSFFESRTDEVVDQYFWRQNDSMS